MPTDQPSTLRVGTWNLDRCPPSSSDKGQEVAAWLDAQKADIWLLTEVHRDWDPRGGNFAVSPARSFDPDRPRRWAGIETTLPLTELTAERDHPGDEGLVLARVDVDGTSVLVASSVLPWKSAGKYWFELPDGQVEQFAFVLDRHVSRIEDAREDGEYVIWGGDFNQPLTPPFESTTKAGAQALREAFDGLGLITLTERSEHRIGGLYSIDHLAVSRGLEDGDAVMHLPTWPDGRKLSDHAAYTADVVLPRT
ncbi:endonuclease/exonuclease/phosphatase family protein [Geodermatophilus sp. SYSU D01180]